MQLQCLLRSQICVNKICYLVFLYLQLLCSGTKLPDNVNACYLVCSFMCVLNLMYVLYTLFVADDAIKYQYVYVAYILMLLE